MAVQAVFPVMLALSDNPLGREPIPKPASQAANNDPSSLNAVEGVKKTAPPCFEP